ncbi:MAG: septum formation initiator family protein, partial [bacterium]
ENTALRNSSAMLEKVAREKLGLAKANEKIFLIKTKTSQPQR